MKKIIFLLGTASFLISCGSSESTTTQNSEKSDNTSTVGQDTPSKEEATPESKTRYIKVDHLNVRKSAGTTDRPHLQLMEGDTVELTGKVSDDKFKASFRGTEYNESWYEVSLNDGSKGWVHGGALQKEVPALEYYKKAEDFDTPEKRKSWWDALSDDYKKAFNIMITSNGETTAFPGDEGVQKIFKEQYIELSPDGGCGDVNFEFKLKDVSGLKNLTNAESINLSYNDISSIRELKGLTKLRNLQLTSNPIKSLEGIGRLKGLKSIDLSSTGSPSLNAFLALKNIESITLDGNNYNNVFGLVNNQKLSSISFQYTKAKSIDGIYLLKNLTSLDISGNNEFESLSVIKGLENVQSLERIDIGYTQITDFTPLKKLTKLKDVIISGSTTSNLKGLEKVKTIFATRYYGEDKEDFDQEKKRLEALGIKFHWIEEVCGC